ncbi:MAG: amidohydrolase [Rhodospirillaceae bacterium]|nr:MAG: amidohydrolase [Rhodospirillaceae bacterium]
MPIYGGPIFDSDTHIHEVDFSFFREFLPKKFHEDWLLEVRNGPAGFGMYIGERVVPTTPGEMREDGLMPPPGRLKEWLAAIASGKDIDDRIKPTQDMYKRRERIAKLDEFGVDGSILFIGHMVTTFGMLDLLAEELGAEGACAVIHAYNEYLLKEWSFNADDRIYSTPILALWDVDWAVKEAKWIADNGGRVIVMPMGPARGKAAADATYDPLWRVLDDNHIVLTFHVSEATFMHPLVRAFGEEPMKPRRMGLTAWQWMFTYSEIPIMMTMASFVYLNFFERFPNIKMVSVENGAEWLPRFLHKMDKMRGMARNGYWPQGQLKERPSTIFKRHCFVVAYPEDDIKKIVDEIGGAECLLMGSDYPHAEGVPTPRDFMQEGCIGLTEPEIRAIMHDNGRRLLPRSA